MSTEKIIILLLVIVLLFGGGGYYVGPWRGGGQANHLVGVLITIIVIAMLLRFFGIY